MKNIIEHKALNPIAEYLNIIIINMYESVAALAFSNHFFWFLPNAQTFTWNALKIKQKAKIEWRKTNKSMLWAFIGMGNTVSTSPKTWSPICADTHKAHFSCALNIAANQRTFMIHPFERARTHCTIRWTVSEAIAKIYIHFLSFLLLKHSLT